MEFLNIIAQYGIVGGSFIFLLYFFIKQYKQLLNENKELFESFLKTLNEINQKMKEDREEMKETKEDIKKIKKTLGV